MSAGIYPIRYYSGVADVAPYTIALIIQYARLAGQIEQATDIHEANEIVENHKEWMKSRGEGLE